MSSKGITVDLAKIKVMMKWPRQTKIIEVRSFLGLAEYDRRFIQDFSKLSSALTQLTKKGKPFVWTPGCGQSFHDFKERLVTTLVLTVSDGSGNLVVYSDASGKGFRVCVHAEG